MKLKMPDPSRKEENRLRTADSKDRIKTPKDKYHAQEDAFQAQALAENMVRSVLPSLLKKSVDLIPYLVVPRCSLLIPSSP